ncbi:hypothetical protein [Pelagibacterium sp.]|uniref:hypothetical protein n=1 Tax=Pelagibacterium sp. TaxID=1967288 RepID=UPI003BA871E7
MNVSATRSLATSGPNSKAAKVAAMLANGYSAPAIAAELNDGTSANAIRAMARHWGLTPKSTDPRHTYCDVSVPLAAKYRTKLAEEARKRGVEMPELMAQVMMTMCRGRALFGDPRQLMS